MRLALMIPLLLVGCTAMDDMHSRDRDALAAELAGRTAGPPQDCVSMEPASSLRPVDSQTLVIDRGVTFYVNRLRGDCPGMHPTDTIIYQANGNQYCRGDRFRTRAFGGGAVPGPICILGQFTPYRRPVR